MEGQHHNQIKDVKMKITMMLLTLVFFSNCTDNQSNYLVKNFVEELIISGENDKIEEYIDLGAEVKSKTEYLDFFEEIFQSIRSELVDGCNLNYELLTFDEARNSNLSSFRQYEKNYAKFEQVHFIICGGKIVLPIIINENNKIISFQSSVLKKLGGDYSPILLNK